jgi:CheY-like chemotaxis protein
MIAAQVSNADTFNRDTVADNGQIALDLIHPTLTPIDEDANTRPYDVVFMDIEMPGQSAPLQDTE